mgnify:CR=1 FL=1
MQLTVRQMNEQIVNILKGIIRQGQQAGAGANMSAKKLLQMSGFKELTAALLLTKTLKESGINL